MAHEYGKPLEHGCRLGPFTDACYILRTACSFNICTYHDRLRLVLPACTHACMSHVRVHAHKARLHCMHSMLVWRMLTQWTVMVGRCMQQLALAILSGIMRKPARERCGSASGRALYRLISAYPGVISATYLRVGCTHRHLDSWNRMRVRAYQQRRASILLSRPWSWRSRRRTARCDKEISSCAHRAQIDTMLT